MRSRREFMALGLTGLIGAGVLPANAYEIRDQAEWRNSFDTAGGVTRERRSNYPILSDATRSATEQAIARYRDIVSRGGWPVISSKETLRTGSRGDAVLALRQRLIISGDLDQYSGRGNTFDS
ncbi:MAG: murein L,D-transpeptidase, partial [Pseudomonadota bacterium]